MPRTRLPAARAEATGAAQKNPQRHRDRRGPQTAASLGDAPAWFDPMQAGMWEGFKKELPWLTESDRAAVEMAAVLRSSFRAAPVDFGATKMNLLRLLLAQLGATPADRSKVAVGDGEETDPDDAFFQ